MADPERSAVSVATNHPLSGVVFNLYLNCSRPLDVHFSHASSLPFTGRISGRSQQDRYLEALKPEGGLKTFFHSLLVFLGSKVGPVPFILSYLPIS